MVERRVCAADQLHHIEPRARDPDRVPPPRGGRTLDDKHTSATFKAVHHHTPRRQGPSG
jgi:hypothetical protein